MHRVAGEMRRDLLDGFEHVAEIGIAVAAAHGRAHGQKDQIGVAHGGGQIGEKLDAAFFGIADQQLFKPRLIDGDLPVFERRDLVRVLVDAIDCPAEFGKADG